MKKIAIDMDEVISHFSLSCLTLFNEEFGENYTAKDLQGLKLAELDERLAGRLDEYIASEHFFSNMQVVQHSQEVIHKLTTQYDVYIVTAAMEFPPSLAPKFNWLKRHFPFLQQQNFVFCGDKSIIKADYLIDDTPSNLDRFEGKGLLFTAPHNAKVQGYNRLNNWLEVETYFLQ